MPLWKAALFFLLFSPYRRVDEWRTAGDKDASFCYPSHSWYNLLVSGLVPPSSRCRTTLHSPSWINARHGSRDNFSVSWNPSLSFCVLSKKRVVLQCLHCHILLFKCYKTTTVATNLTLVTDERIRSIWWNCTEKRTPQYWEKNMSRYYFAHKNSHMYWLYIKPGSPM